MQTQRLPFTKPNIAKTFAILAKGKVGVIPTDTLYGVVGQALNKKTVERIYKVRKRNPKKPVLILISSFNDLKKFSVTISPEQKKVLQKVWPGPTSVVLPAPLKKFEYLHRGTKALAFRLPANPMLRAKLKTSGPLIAPSANTEGQKPAGNYEEAYDYFKDSVDAYLDAGEIESEHSTLAVLEGLSFRVLREGAGDIPLKLRTILKNN